MNDIEISSDIGSSRFVAAIGKAIGHPTRMRILCMLLERETCICGEIVDDLGQAQSTVSQHLKTMKAAGLIRGTVDGPRVCYCLDRSVWQDFQTIIAGLQAPRQARPPTTCCTEDPS